MWCTKYLTGLAKEKIYFERGEGEYTNTVYGKNYILKLNRWNYCKLRVPWAVCSASKHGIRGWYEYGTQSRKIQVSPTFDIVAMTSALVRRNQNITKCPYLNACKSGNVPVCFQLIHDLFLLVASSLNCFLSVCFPWRYVPENSTEHAQLIMCSYINNENGLQWWSSCWSADQNSVHGWFWLSKCSAVVDLARLKCGFVVLKPLWKL